VGEHVAISLGLIDLPWKIYFRRDGVNTLSACDKAIEGRPKKADAYFLKGSLLFGNGAVKPNGKYSVPKGTADALEKYLVLAPTGGHAEEVKQMLQTME